jgi:hypothetical protein
MKTLSANCAKSKTELSLSYISWTKDYKTDIEDKSQNSGFLIGQFGD